jgi:hypothetical protein
MFCTRCALPRFIAFIDNGSVEDVPAKGDGEMGGGILCEFQWLHRRPGVYGCEDILGAEDVLGDFGGHS